MLRRELHESNWSPTATADWRTSEQYEEICELKKHNVVLKDSLDDTEKKLDHVKLSVNRGESQVKRLSQQIEELQETVHVFQEAEECKDPELAFSEVSGRTFSGTVNRDHVSEAKFSQPQCC